MVIYTNYESDATGMYDVMAGADTLVANNLSNTKTVKVQADKYLVFSAQGEIPNVCIELWKEIWGYFSSEICEYERLYTTDFESYSNCKSGIEIYIAIK